MDSAAQENEMDAQQTVEYLENEKIIVRAVSSLTKDVSRRYATNHPTLDIRELNVVLKAALCFTFGVKQDEIPDFVINYKIHAVTLSLGDLATLVSNITKSFDTQNGSNRDWKWA